MKSIIKFSIITIVFLISWSFLHIQPEHYFENKTINDVVLKLKVLDAKLNQEFLKSQLRLSSINYDVINLHLIDENFQRDILTTTIKNIKSPDIENAVKTYLSLSKQKEEYLEILKSETSVLSNSLHYLNTDYVNLKNNLSNSKNVNSLEYLHNNLILYNLNPDNVDLENEISRTLKELVLRTSNQNENAEFIANFLGHSSIVLENTKLLHTLTQELNKLKTVNALEDIENSNNAMRRYEQTVVYNYQLLLGISTLLLLVGIIYSVRRYDKSATLLQESLYELERQKYALDQHAIVSMADKNGIIIYANENFIAISGYSSEELIGQSHRLLNSGYHPHEFFTEMWQTISQGNVWEGKVCNRNKQGDLYWVQSTIVPFLNPDGTIHHYISIRTDITLQKKMEIAAIEASNLKSDFLSTMSHEIRTPMNGIIGMTEVLMDTSLDEEQLEFVNIIKNSSHSLLTIINDILDFSKIEAGKLSIEITDFSLQNVLEGSADIIANRAYEKSLSLMTFIDPAIPDMLLGDPTRLQQVVLNFLSNAIKFTAKGYVNLNATLINKTESTVTVRIEIIDTGIGISSDAQERLFQPFSQADSSTTRKYGGTGLGLSISKRLIELMGGNIGLNSVLGQGSTFWIELPFEISQQNNEVTINQLSGKRILVVGRNTGQHEIYLAYLSSWGILVNTTDNTDELIYVLQEAQSLRQPYDLILLVELSVEKMLLIIESIKSKENLKNFPIIACQEAINLNIKKQLIDSGVTTVLVKPVKQSVLFDAIMTILFSEKIKKIEQISQVAVNEIHRNPNENLILLVEDNLVNQQVAKHILHKLGYAIHIVNNGKEALDSLESSNYGLVLMDCQMPIMDGFEATNCIRKREQEFDNRKRIPIIAMTANAIEGDRENCLAAGMDDYVSKPINKEILADVLKKWLPEDYEKKGIEVIHQSEFKNTDSPIDMRRMLDLFDNDEEIIYELLSVFTDSIEPLKMKLATAVENKSLNIKAIAHEIKGSSHNIGAVTLAQLAGNLESALPQQNWTEIGMLSDLIQKELVRVKNFIALKGCADEH